jgi:hypothetical protein
MQSRVSIDSVALNDRRLRGSSLVNLPWALTVSRPTCGSKPASSASNVAWLLTSTGPGRRMRNTGWWQSSQVWRLSSFSRYAIAVLTTVAWLHVSGLTLIGSFVYGLTCSASTPDSSACDAVHSKIGRASFSSLGLSARWMK